MLEPVDTTENKFYIHIPYLWIWLLIKASTDKSIFKFWNIMINPNEQIYWNIMINPNVEFWALHICLFSALGNRTLKLKELLNEAFTIYDHNNSICKISHFNNYTVYLNADGAALSKLLALQTKWRNMESNNPQKINDKMIKEECKKVGKFQKRLQPECLIVSKDNFVKFYGNVYSSRAQFAATFFAGGNKICINSTKFWELRVLDGVGEIIANEISSERDKRKFDDVDDLCKRIKKIPKNIFRLYEALVRT
nr:15644_t:CDS:2 [Entrophospora candida]